MGRLDISVPVRPGSWMENRNGLPDISQIRVWESKAGLHTENGPVDVVFIESSNMRGRELRGGFYIDKEAFIELCVLTLRQEGYSLYTAEEMDQMDENNRNTLENLKAIKETLRAINPDVVSAVEARKRLEGQDDQI